MQRQDESKDYIDELFNKITFTGSEAALNSHKGLTKVLLSLLQARPLLLPKNKMIRVIGPACGVPLDYLALRAFYDPQKIQIYYTGIDIDADQNVEVENMLSNFSDSFKIITGDCSNKDSTKKFLEAKGCMPDGGFDLVVFRQPRIFDRTFAKMLLEVIPFISAQQSHTFISCYFQTEMARVMELVQSGPYSFPEDFGVELSSASTNIIGGISLVPDQCSIIVGCAGSVYPRAGSSRVASLVRQNMFAESKQSEYREPREIQRQIDARVKALKERRPGI